MKKAKVIVTEVVKQGVAPLLKRAGFKKEGLRFYRRLDGVLQIIGFQFSQANFADQGEFFINVAFGFDTLWLSESSAIPEQPKEHECHLQKRIEEILPDMPPSWHVSSSTDVDELSRELTERISLLLSEMDCMNETSAFLQGEWLKVGSERILKGRLFYASGDANSAMTELRAAAEFFCRPHRYVITGTGAALQSKTVATSLVVRCLLNPCCITKKSTVGGSRQGSATKHTMTILPRKASPTSRKRIVAGNDGT